MSTSTITRQRLGKRGREWNAVPKSAALCEKPEGYNPKLKAKDNPKVYCHFCWFEEDKKRDPGKLGSIVEAGKKE